MRRTRLFHGVQVFVYVIYTLFDTRRRLEIDMWLSLPAQGCTKHARGGQQFVQYLNFLPENREGVSLVTTAARSSTSCRAIMRFASGDARDRGLPALRARVGGAGGRTESLDLDVRRVWGKLLRQVDSVAALHIVLSLGFCPLIFSDGCELCQEAFLWFSPSLGGAGGVGCKAVPACDRSILVEGGRCGC